MERIKTYVILGETAMLLLLCWILWGGHKADESNLLPSHDSTISRITVTVYVPIKGLNKQESQAEGIISKDVAKDESKAVLASGHIEDDSGIREVSAVIDTGTGVTKILEKRPLIESMSRFEIGAGYGFESGDLAKAAQIRGTFERVGRLYFTGQLTLFDVDRIENNHPWNALAFMNFRF